MENTIKYTVSDKFLTIKVPVNLLKYLANTHPDGPFKVKSQKDLANEVLETILEEDSDTGLNKFEELIESSIPDVVDSGSENVYSVADEQW